MSNPAFGWRGCPGRAQITEGPGGPQTERCAGDPREPSGRESTGKVLKGAGKQTTIESMKKKSWIYRIWAAVRKPLAFLPAVFMAFLIFGFSAQTGQASASLSGQVTEKIVLMAERLASADWTQEEIREKTEAWEFYVRKAAHMTEYAVFAVTWVLPLYGCGFRGKRLILTTLAICGGFAAGDEWHQSFVGGRGPSVRDVGIDCIGAGIGTGISFLIFCRKNRKKDRLP